MRNSLKKIRSHHYYLGTLIMLNHIDGILVEDDKRFAFNFIGRKFQSKNIGNIKNPDFFKEHFHDLFQEFIRERKNHRGAVVKREAALSFVLYHLFSVYQEDQEQPANKRVFHLHSILFESIRKRIAKANLAFIAPMNKGRKETYYFGEVTFSHQILVETLTFLITKKYLYHEKGYCIHTEKSEEEKPPFARGYLYLNGKKIEPVYSTTINDQLTDTFKCPSFSPEIIFRKRLQPSDKKLSDVDYRQYLPTRCRAFEDSRAYLNRLWKMYQNMSVGLADYRECSPEVQKKIATTLIAKNEKYNRKKKYEKKHEKKSRNTCLRDLFFSEESYNQERIQELNILKCLGRKPPTRVFHLNDENKVVFGRIYNNLGVNTLSKPFAPLLTIHGEHVTEIDIKSSYVQLYVLHYQKKQDNFQDFYQCRKLMDEEGFTREMVKKLYFCILNSPNEVTARKSFFYVYGNQFKKSAKTNVKKRKNKNKTTRIVRSLRVRQFEKWVKAIFAERRYLKKLKYNPALIEELTKIESDYMMEVGKRLMKEDILFIHHMDALYVQERNQERTLEIMAEVSEEKWKRKIRLEYSNHLVA